MTFPGRKQHAARERSLRCPTSCRFQAQRGSGAEGAVLFVVAVVGGFVFIEVCKGMVLFLNLCLIFTQKLQDVTSAH